MSNGLSSLGQPHSTRRARFAPTLPLPRMWSALYSGETLLCPYCRSAWIPQTFTTISEVSLSPGRFIFYDGDAIRSKNFQAVQNALYIGDSLTWPTSAESTLLLRKLLQNPSYRNFFVGRVYGIARMFPFKCYLQMNFKQNVAALKGEIASQSARFGSPTSVRSWRHAVRQQQRYWRHRSDRFQNEWIRSINMCYGEHFTLLPSPGYLVVSIVLVIALVIMLVIKSRLD